LSALYILSRENTECVNISIVRHLVWKKTNLLQRHEIMKMFKQVA